VILSRLFKGTQKNRKKFFSSELCMLVLIFILTLLLRVYRLEHVPTGLFWDEISAVYTPYLYQMGLVDLSFRSIIAYLSSGTFFTYLLFGSSVFFTRMPAVFNGTLLVLVVYLLAKEVYTKRVGLISASLMAVCPWALFSSRSQALTSAYVLYFTIALLFLYKGINSKENKKKFIWFCLGSLLLGLTANILASSRVFIPLFIVGFLITYFWMKPQIIRSYFFTGIVLSTIFLIMYLPVFIDYIIHDPTTTLSMSYSTYSHSKNIFDLIIMVLERAYLHLSPGFLVFTVPSTHDLSFKSTISQSALIRLSPTIFGELNYYGVLVYPGLLLLAYKVVRKRNKQDAILLWWTVCYLIVSGIAYYDNPNPARNIVGLPALIITIALFINSSIEAVNFFQFKFISHFYFKSLVVILLISFVAFPSGLFLHDYYVNYPTESAKVFDYGYREVAKYLSVNDLWERDVYIHNGWGRDLTLSFYSPKQPPIGKITTILNIHEFSLTNFNQISKEFYFKHGIIEYEMWIERSYGLASSMHISLFYDENNTLALSIYAEDSTYEPNGYLLLQEDNGERYFEQRPLNEVIEYGKWYLVRLIINSTAVSFYFDGKLITSSSRPSDDIYRTILLAGESATVCFRNFRIQENSESHDLFETNSLSDWKIISGKKEIKGNFDDNRIVTLLPISYNAILVTQYQEDLETLLEYGTSCTLLKKIHYPDGSLAFLIYELKIKSRR